MGSRILTQTRPRGGVPCIDCYVAGDVAHFEEAMLPQTDVD